MAFRRSGPLHAWRIADARRPILNGVGAALHGGRWNSPGRWAIYAAETYAGALLEKLVHTNIGQIPRNQKYIEILVPAGVAIEEVEPGEIPGWDLADQAVSRAYGDRWYDQQRTAVLLTPSVVTRTERNVLIHQRHRHFPRIRASHPRLVRWDERLFRR